VPLPVPDAPLTTEIHPTLLAADHPQPVPVVTDTLLALAPIAGAVAVVGDRLYEQAPWAGADA
jgi:hypothetical protein